MRCQSSIELSLKDPFDKMPRFARTTEALMLGFVDAKREFGGNWPRVLAAIPGLRMDWAHWCPRRPADDRGACARRLRRLGAARQGRQNGEARSSLAPCGQTPC